MTENRIPTTIIPVTAVSPYQVYVGEGLGAQMVDVLGSLGAARALLVYQPTVQGHIEKVVGAARQAGLEVFPVMVPDAEAAKDVTVLSALWDECASAVLSRSDVVLSLGGGAVTDLAGFVAATWMRGIRVVHISTSLLGCVDAAVGGKTGINTPAGKNLVGAFHEPSAVFIDLDFLRTLPRSEMISGSAEVIKTGFIADEKILQLYEADAEACLRVGPVLHELIERSVRVKASVVSQDLKESGLREILNYGHTFGHAVENREHYTWRHGNAVGVGMMFAAHLSEQRGLIDAALVERHRAILQAVGLPISYEQGNFSELYDAMTRDKKNRSGRIRFVALDGGVGAVTRIEGPSHEELERAYQKLAEVE